MANEAVELHQPVARRWPRIPFELRLGMWWCFWLLILLFLFSGILIAIGPLKIKTIALDWAFIGEWWPFISKGVIITFELSILSMIFAVVLALSAALARLSQVATQLDTAIADARARAMRGICPPAIHFDRDYRPNRAPSRARTESKRSGGCV